MIRVDHITKKFVVPHQVTKTLFHKLTSAFHPAYDYEEFFALKDVSFEVGRGEFVGIMGRNGSGKTTLLRIIAGIYQPTSGSCVVQEEISPLLELGLGFQPRLTCRDNIFIYGALLGFTRKEIARRKESILQFAELERFADAPLDHLSSGMKVRLAFSIAMQSPAPIMLVDEVLAVGDAIFQQKCREVFWQFKREGRTILLVSHDPSAIKEYCNRVLILNDGVLVDDCPVAEMDSSAWGAVLHRSRLMKVG